MCGVYAPSIMAAHHLNPDEKDGTVGRMGGKQATIDELTKCVPLCFNHHQLVHSALRNGGQGLGWDALVEYVRDQYPLNR